MRPTACMARMRVRKPSHFGAAYVLPDQFRERGKSGTPLRWPWPDELLLASAKLLIAAERIDRVQSGEGVRHLQVVDIAGGLTEIFERTLHLSGPCNSAWSQRRSREEDGNALVRRGRYPRLRSGPREFACSAACRQ